MTSAALTAGCAFLAFSPTFFLLVLMVHRKAHLIIIVTTSAFAFLIGSLFSSLVWLVVPSSLRTNPFLLIFPAVVCQALGRCGFVHMYHKVEGAIIASIRVHERQTCGGARGAADNSSSTNEPMSESAKLTLELNDWSCGIATGVGYGGMHALMLYGTLLASETGGMGTLYQSSCSIMPSIVNSALNAFLFSILDMVLVLLTFYGMRQRKTKEGVIALLASVIFHTGAAFSTTANGAQDGCKVSLPLVAGFVLATLCFFQCYVARRFLSEVRYHQE